MDLSEGLHKKSDFEINAKNIQDLLYYCLLDSDHLDKNLSAYEDMHPLVKIAFSNLALNLLVSIYFISEDFSVEIESGIESKYSTSDLAHKYSEANKGCVKEISDLMDAYIEATEKEEITVIEDNEKADQMDFTTVPETTN